jgi:hypothetical protein
MRAAQYLPVWGLDSQVVFEVLASNNPNLHTHPGQSDAVSGMFFVCIFTCFSNVAQYCNSSFFYLSNYQYDLKYSEAQSSNDFPLVVYPIISE